MTKTREIRKKFLDTFASYGHTIVPSSPVIPLDDPTLLFINAGMNQFKDVFLDKSKRDYTRATSSQKCIRVGGKHNDLDNVGHTTRHMTFFEMLGNFSFGDYFKKEAIQHAWDVTLNVFEFEKDKIWVSVFETDDEAAALWEEHVDPSRIVRMGEADNFWTMGDTGPCGPCSELYYDRGPEYGDATSPANDPEGNRFIEFWNLVFMQYERDASGKQTPLAKQSIDTGAGLERIVMLKIGAGSVFETDILQKLIGVISKLAKKPYDRDPAFHVIADHIRTLAFAIADGVTPSNVDRGYVLRKVLRRAVRYARKLGLDKPFLTELIPTLLEEMGDDYPELKTAETRINEIILEEEESFYKTLHRGGNILQSIIDHSKKEISGADAFKLKDTYGFPLEEILLIAHDAGLGVNLEQYQVLEEQAKERSRAVHKKHAQTVEASVYKEFGEKHTACEFLGYDDLEEEGTILGILSGGKFVESLDSGEEAEIFLDRTPFYSEKGGQVGDHGLLVHDNAQFKVIDTQCPFEGVVSHRGTLEKGMLLVGEPVTSVVNAKRRDLIARHHSATHLLHWALTEVLGDAIKQGGSLVDTDRLRFDFSHHKAMTPDQIWEVERLVNQKIWDGSPVETEEVAYASIQNDPSVKQFFGDKYGETVRVVSMGHFAKELCGGTHVNETNRIGFFKIAKELSVAKGVRRIEAVLGEEALRLSENEARRIHAIAEKVGAPEAKLEERIDHLLSESSALKALKKERLGDLAKSLSASKEEINGLQVICQKLTLSPKELNGLAQNALGHIEKGVLCLATEFEGKAMLLIRVVNCDLDAGALIKEMSPHIEGSGGGKKDAAQAGGTKPSGLDDAIRTFRASL